MATPNPNVRAPPSEVDIIVVGGGAAGCIVAGRLAKADPSLQIAIIEAGQVSLVLFFPRFVGMFGSIVFSCYSSAG